MRERQRARERETESERERQRAREREAVMTIGRRDIGKLQRSREDEFKY